MRASPPAVAGRKKGLHPFFSILQGEAKPGLNQRARLEMLKGEPF
jgi:hypothetical protein